MSLYSVGYHVDPDKFKWIVALSRNLDMLNFAHYAYAMNEDVYPIKAKKSDEDKSWGKRKIVDLSNFDDEAHENPNNEGAKLSENEGGFDSVELSNPKEFDDPRNQNHPSLIPVDNRKVNVGKFWVVLRQMAEKASEASMFFGLEVDVQ